jgi:hypothetical protein
LPILAFVLFLLILPIFAVQVQGCDPTTTLFAHAETTTLPGGNVYYLHKLCSPADGPATIISKSATSTGRKVMGRWLYPLSGIFSIQASTWTVSYRVKKSASASYVVAHGDVDILIRKSDNTIRTTIAIDVANSPVISGSNIWQTLTGTYNWPGYTVVDQTDYLEVVYYIEVTRSQSSKQVRLLFDDSTLPLADQTKVENVLFTYANQAPVASFTYSPDYPLIYEDVTFNASASYDPDGSIVNYMWDFGDGNVTTVTSSTIAHVYTIAGSQVNYTVTLTVTDNGGATGLATQIVTVTNPTILYVSLPAGTYVGPNPDKWLSQCWFINNTGSSASFTVRITNTACGVISYDTHLIIALSDAAYTNFGSLTVDATSIPKSSFVYGTPTPYGYTLTWEEDVYPTWYSDIYVVGTINSKCYVEISISATFSNPNGVRMHFDAYGSAKCPPPSKVKYVTHNPHEKDSTVLFSPPPVIQYHLTVRTDPLGVTTIPGEGWYDEGTLVTLDAPENAPVSSDARYSFSYWDVDEVPRVIGVNPITVYMDANHVATAHYVLQYSVVFNHAGLHPDADGTIVTVDGELIPIGTLPYTKWVNEGDSVTYLYTSVVPSIGSGKRFRLDSVSGPPSPIVVTGSATVTGNYVVQYLLRFTQTGLDSTASGTIVTVNGNPKTYAQLPYEDWFDEDSLIPYLYTSPVPSTESGKRFRLNTVTGPSSPITVSIPMTVTGNYVTQYLLSFRQTGLDLTAMGTIVTVNGNPKTYAQLPYDDWFDRDSQVTYLYTSPVPSTESGKKFRLDTIAGPISPITVTESVTVTGNYVTQYLLTFTYADLDSDATGTVVTVNGNAKFYEHLPYSEWFDRDSWVTYSYNDIVLSTVTGKQFKLEGVSGPTSPIYVTSSVTVTGDYKTQFKVTFAQTGVGPDFEGTVVTIDGTPYTRDNLPRDFDWDQGSTHTFAFASPLIVNADKHYLWESTSGLSTLQSDTLTITTSGSVVGDYSVANCIIFDKVGVDPDFTGTIIIIDGTPYSTLPQYFYWEIGTSHDFAFQSPLVVDAGKKYLWISTTGLSDKQSDSITVTTYGSVVGHYKTQYYLTLTTNPPDVTIPTGAGWHDASTYASISTSEFVPIVPDSSRWRFNGWTTANMGEITNPSAPSTTVLMDEAKTVTAKYVIQYYFTVSSPSHSPPCGSPIPPPPGEWFDEGTEITASVTSPWPGPSGTRYVCTGWIGTGSVPPTGTGSSVTFTINAPSSITWNWKTQHYLTVQVSPGSITTIPGEGWYDASTNVPLEAPTVANYEFRYWDVNGTSQGIEVNPITVSIDAPYAATAHYTQTGTPVGGYSVSLNPSTEATPLIGYSMILAIFGAIITLIRRKRK